MKKGRPCSVERGTKEPARETMSQAFGVCAHRNCWGHPIVCPKVQGANEQDDASEVRARMCMVRRFYVRTCKIVHGEKVVCAR